MREEAMADWFRRHLGWISGVVALVAWFGLLYVMFWDVL